MPLSNPLVYKRKIHQVIIWSIKVGNTQIYFFSFYFIVFTFIYMCIHVYIVCATSPVTPPLIDRTVFVLRFCWSENIGNKKDKSFLLVWDKDSYTERFLVLRPCTYELQPTLFHLYQISSLLPGPLPIVASISLRLLYLLLYSEHINHIQVLGLLLFPYFSRACSPLSVWPMPNNITAFVLGL
jgi:hypothetical protein